MPNRNGDTTISDVIDRLENRITILESQNKKLRAKVRRYKEAQESIERCECCKKIATKHDVEGVPLCKSCYNSMVKEAQEGNKDKSYFAHMSEDRAESLLNEIHGGY